MAAKQNGIGHGIGFNDCSETQDLTTAYRRPDPQVQSWHEWFLL
jgi:hypothetical protein